MERLDHFMARANAAYYATHDPFADFTTAPEIAQMFGELLGAWAAVVWRGMGRPDPVLLVEAGPGRGTLMHDARRATARVAPDFHAACQVHFIETSLRLRAVQAVTVPDATWHVALETIPAGPAIVVANEFLDALPIRQFEHRDGAWRERFVQDGRLVLQASAQQAPAPEGAVWEENAAARAWVSAVSSRIVADGGVALILDYGRAQAAFGDSLQALRHGRPADPLDAPGEADLTAHIDFAAIAQAAMEAGAKPHGPVSQGAFLDALGLRVRTERLAAASPARAAGLRNAADRLASPSRMGQLFKALAITSPESPTPPGFPV